MKLNKIKICNSATTRVQQLKGRTGLTPNILCRIGFCLSLSDPVVPNASQYAEDGMEFNRYTLTGENDLIYSSLLKQYCSARDLDLKDQFRAHLNRGIFLLWGRIKSLNDILRLLPT